MNDYRHAIKVHADDWLKSHDIADEVRHAQAAACWAFVELCTTVTDLLTQPTSTDMQDGHNLNDIQDGHNLNDIQDAADNG